MMEKFKTGALVVLVALSLVQSYFLAYSVPSLRTTTTTDQDYVQTEQMGDVERLENLIYPEDMVVHLGENRHTVFYPGTNFYERIFEKLRGREFKGFQRGARTVVDWGEVRTRDQGVELRFGSPMPVELLQRVLKLEADPQFLSDQIDRIWIFNPQGREEVRVYFFSSDRQLVYESVRADLTISDIQEYVGYGTYWPQYRTTDGLLYLPTEPLETVQAVLGYDSYTTEQMQRNLFFDPAVTRTIRDRSGTQIFTDGKQGLQVEQNGQWVRYTDPVASSGNVNNLTENVVAALQFTNEHGGWDGKHRFVNPGSAEGGRVVVFQQYWHSLPVITEPPLRFGQIRLTLQRGGVGEYERSLLTLGEEVDKSIRYLPGGETLTNQLQAYERRDEVRALYPALQAEVLGDEQLSLTPVWAVRLTDGTQQILSEALPSGTAVEISIPVTPVEEQEGQTGTEEAEGMNGEADLPDGESPASVDISADGVDDENDGDTLGDEEGAPAVE
ncbi:YycH family regulatory protein [Paenibacillus sp. 1P07SE]|uniref:YycH family regulatory protein n=1 Tax=Paenibacillus sp. 1P07SE TaxID=3132209 RepID=UPI0039A592F3